MGSVVDSESVSSLRVYILSLCKLLIENGQSDEMTKLVSEKQTQILRIFLTCLGLRGYTRIGEEAKDINEKEISA